MKGSLLRRIAAFLGLALVAGAAAYALWPRPIPVDIATIAAGPLEVFVEDEGVSRIKNIYTVSSPIAGKVLRSPREVGDEVMAGKTPVAIVEPTDPGLLDIRTQRVNEAAVEAANAAVDLAEAQVRQAQSQLEFARGDLRRAQSLNATNAISERAFDKARLDVATAEAALATARATLEVRRRELESARAALIQPLDRQGRANAQGDLNGYASGNGNGNACCVHISAPVTGRVLKLHVESEQVVPAGRPLIDLGDPANLEIVVNLLSRDAVRVEPGAPALIENWGGPYPLRAEVRRVSPTAFTKVSALGIEEQRVETVLDLTDPPERWQRLGHDFRVIARISVWRGENVVQVPLGALFRQGAQWAVYGVENGVASRRLIMIGERDGQAAQVLSGLKAGDRVILHPSDRIAPGVKVIQRESVE